MSTAITQSIGDAVGAVVDYLQSLSTARLVLLACLNIPVLAILLNVLGQLVRSPESFSCPSSCSSR
jgi:hypothetical protein